MRLSAVPVLAIVLALTPSVVRAADAPMDEIIVTATRRATVLRDVPASVSTLDRDRFALQATRFIGEELRGLPGVVLGTNDAGTYTKVTLRGVPNRIHNDTLVVLLDGVPFVTADDEVDLEQLPLAAVGRVDLVRGPMGALYGRGAIAGTLNYLTRTVDDRREATVEAGLGSQGWRRLSATAQAPTGPGSALLVLAEHERADGWRDRTGREQTSLFAKQRIDLAGWGSLNLTASRVDQDQDLAGELPVDAQGRLIPLPGGRDANWNQDGAGFAKRMTLGTAILEADLAAGLSTTTRLHARHADTSAIQGFFNPFTPGDTVVAFTGFRVDGDNTTLFADQQVDWTLGPVRLLAGASHERIAARHVETWTGEFDFGPLFYAQRRDIATGALLNRDQWRSDRLLDADSLARNWAAYAQADWDVGRLTLSAGARWDRFSRAVDYGPSGSGYGPDPLASVSDSDQRISPKAAITWRLSDQLTAYAAYGAGFSPGFGPLWSFRGRDTTLAPETAENVEAGVKGSLLDGRLTASATLYHLERRDLLQLLPVGGTARTINSGRQRSRGVEIDAVAALDTLVPGLSLSASYGFTDAVWLENRFLEPDTGRPFDFTGKDVPGVPRHAGRVTLAQALPDQGLRVELWVDATGDYPFDSANSVTGGGHALWNAALRWTPIPALDLTATVRNLFDRPVNSVVGNNDGPFAAFPQPPRQVFIGARMSF